MATHGGNKICKKHKGDIFFLFPLCASPISRYPKDIYAGDLSNYMNAFVTKCQYFFCESKHFFKCMLFFQSLTITVVLPLKVVSIIVIYYRKETSRIFFNVQYFLLPVFIRLMDHLQ